MSKDDHDQTVRELTMVLLYLTGFRASKYAGPNDLTSWKGYDFDVLNELGEEELIFQGRNPSRTKSVSITEAGVEYAKAVLKKYGIPDRE
ncbi:MAG: transposase [Thermoplasmata archaeon]|nr:transposase [Thermoplasmata archaeon]